MAAQLPPPTPQLTAVEETLKKVQEQLTCAICLEDYTHPKVLRCFHVFCTKCVERLVQQDAQGQTVQCPNCRQPTLLPPKGVPGLQGAFHVHHLFDIRNTLLKVNKASCEKCKKLEATSFCRSCGFVCDKCKEYHQFFEELTSHEIVSLDKLTGDLTSVVPPHKKVLFCSKHEGKQLELFCETCCELICHNCTTKIHKGHNCDVVSDTFETHKAEIISSLKPVQQQLKTVKEALKQINLSQKYVTYNQVALETQISSFASRLIAAVNAKKQALIEKLAETTHQKLKSLSSQEDEIKMVETRLSGCLEVVERSLQTGTQGEVLAAKKAVLKKIADLTADFQPQSLVPREQADTKVAPSDAALKSCGEFADLYAAPVHPAPGKCTLHTIPKWSFPEKEVKTTLNIIDANGKKVTGCSILISYKLVSSDGTTAAVNELVKKTDMGQCELSYTTPARSGQYQLHVKVQGQPIQDSPFRIVIVRDLRTPLKTISGLSDPWGIAVNKRGHIIVSEHRGHCITVFSGNGNKLTSFGSYGLGPGQLSEPRGIAVDEDDNILVADTKNDCIQKFSPQGKFLETQGKHGKNALEFSWPSGVGIHPLNKRVYVIESIYNNRVQVLDATLKHVTMFGSCGKGEGQFKGPKDVSFDGAGNCYIADNGNHQVQVFTEDGQYLRQFGKEGKGEGELTGCIGLTIDSDIVYIANTGNHRISVFTTDGSFIASFGKQGSEPGQFDKPHGVTVDMNGLVYICDFNNSRIQVF